VQSVITKKNAHHHAYRRYIELLPFDHCSSVDTCIPVIPTHVHLSVNSLAKAHSTPSFSPPTFSAPPLIQCYLGLTSIPAKWHLIPSNGFDRVHECDRRHTYINIYRRTDHATVTCVAIGGIFQRCRLIIIETMLWCCHHSKSTARVHPVHSMNVEQAAADSSAFELRGYFTVTRYTNYLLTHLLGPTKPINVISK